MESWKIEFEKRTWDSGDYREGGRRSFLEKAAAWGRLLDRNGTELVQGKQKLWEITGPLSRQGGPDATRAAAPRWGKLALGQDRKPPKAALSLGKKEKEISRVRRSMDCRFVIKITVPSSGNQKFIYNPLRILGAQVENDGCYDMISLVGFLYYAVGIGLTDDAYKQGNTPTMSPKEDISDRWWNIHGVHEWEGLLDPLHPLLRREIVKYGEFAQATYDALDIDSFYEYRGIFMYNSYKLFDKSRIKKTGYKVTKYIYAMS
ncbi:hypothetical protein MTR67_034893 [Solanum verrucosum]|uniref:Uncharacterized protein n=1 Tax=Solanum verrucosum TaxID=315347 RepID=A0AAF0ZKY0_SOLVR|nr:hypothetical protein MTR67_034893 [Solanum verrucosum]